MRKASSRSVVIVGAALLGLGVSACTPQIALPQGNPIRIGAPISLTGSQQQAGQMVDEGYQLCQDWVNGKGGVKVGNTWHQLDIIREDDQSRVSISAAITERMVSQDGIRFLLGPSNNATTAQDAQIADAHGVPMVEGAGPSESIFNAGHHWVFGVEAPASRLMQGVIDLALAHWAVPHTLSVLFADDSWNTELANQTNAYASDRGMQVVYFQGFASGVNTLGPWIAGASAPEPDVVIEVGELRDSVQGIEDARALNAQAKMFGFAEGPGTDGFVSSLKSSAENTVGASQWVRDARTHVTTFLTSAQYVAQYESQFGHAPNAQSAAATAACIALINGIQRANSLKPEEVRTALTQLDLHTFFGEIKFDDRGANMAKTVYVVQVQHGKPVVVWPAEAATGLPRYPWPGWTNYASAAPSLTLPRKRGRGKEPTPPSGGGKNNASPTKGEQFSEPGVTPHPEA